MENRFQFTFASVIDGIDKAFGEKLNGHRIAAVVGLLRTDNAIRTISFTNEEDNKSCESKASGQAICSYYYFHGVPEF
jgi:hypothetical protein